MIPGSQHEVAALLRDVTGAAPIETHISAVFVGRDDAFKLKKSVRLPFLDFSTLAAREQFTRRELELNRPAAPGIYRGVLPVTRKADGALALGGDGEPVEWVLRMARVPPGDFLNAVAARGGLDGPMLDAVADAVVALHAGAPVVAGVDAPARMRTVLAGNIESCRGTGLDEVRVAEIADALAARIEAVAPALAARSEAGCVRRCHGDLHLGNLCLWEGRPTAFDALEFDEALARIDVGYDLAFLLMDLDVRVSRDAANRVLNRVVARAGDVGLLAPLPIWLALRALVRAHVEARRHAEGAQATSRAEGASYLDAAAGDPRRVPPRLVAVGGLQGTGKTWLSRDLAPRLGVAPGALHLRTDEIRKRRAGVAPEARLPASAYAPAESAAVHAELFAAARAALAAGHSVVLDAVFLDPAIRVAAREAAGAAPFAGLWLEAPMDVLRARIGARRGDASDATVAVMEQAAAADAGPLDWHRLDAAEDPRGAAQALLALNGESGA